eukprot:gene17121-19520_t
MKKSAQVFPSWISTTVSKFGDKKKNRQVASISERDEAEATTSQMVVPADVVSGESFLKAPRIVFKGHLLPVRCVGVLVTPNPEDSLVCSGGDDKLVILWSLKTGKKIAELSGHAQRVICLSTFQGAGSDSYVISGSWDERVRIWPLKDCFPLNSTLTTTTSEAKENEEILSLSERLSTQSIVLKGHTNRIFSTTVVTRPGEAPFVASSSADNTIRVWSLPDGHPLYVLEDDEDATWNLCLSSWFIADNGECPYHGTVLISGCKNTTVRVWRHHSEEEVVKLASKASVLGDALKHAVDALAGRPSATTVRTAPDLVISGHTSAVHAVAPFSHQDQPFVVTACKDLDLRIFSLLTGALVKILRGHTSSISSLAVRTVANARGGAIIVSSSREGANLRVWKYSTGECVRFFKGHTQDINAVAVFPSPDARRDDLILVTASKDTTVRSWLFAEEKVLKVLDHGSRQKVKVMDVLHREANSLVVTGVEDGSLRAWRTKRDEGDEEHSALEWKVEKAHKNRVLALCIYTPLRDDDGYFATHINKHWPAHLHTPLVFSASRNGQIRVSSMEDGHEVIPPFEAHSSAVTSLAVCAGARATAFHKALDPFLVSGSEDNTAILWSLLDFTKLRVFEGHIFDVTCVSIYVPKPAPNEQTFKAMSRSLASARVTPREGAFTDGLPADTLLDPIIMTGGMDSVVRLWQYSSNDCVEVLTAADSHITCLTCINILESDNTKHVGPVMVAGDGAGMIYIWSLVAPFKQLYTLRGHADEVRSVYAFDAEGIPPVLVSGSLDCTVKVWNLETMKLHKTLEGHTSDVTAVRVFNLGGSDLAMVSASLDTTVRVEFDFMEAAPQLDIVLQLFNFDANGTNIHVIVDANTSFPRIAALAKKEGPEQFFGTYFALFGAALRQGRCDFLEEFLPQSNLGLVRSNKGKASDGMEMEADYYGLLKQALDRSDTKAVRIIVDCWCKFYSDASSDLIHDEDARINLDDLIQLSEEAPAEFTRLICSIKLIPVKDSQPPPEAHFLFEQDSDHSIRMGRMPSKETIKATPQAAESALTGKTYLYLPVSSAAHMRLLFAYCSACEELDSVEIFNSDVGKLALAYAWRRFGLHVHLVKMVIYCTFVALSTVSLLTFTQFMGESRTVPVAYALIIAQLALDAFFIIEERKQFLVNPLLYFTDVWNAMDALVVISNVVANVLRLVYLEDTIPCKVFLCITSIVGYFNILYYLRAFESTGPLVSMIMKISNDMTNLIAVVLIVLVGFSQAFWIISSVDRSLPFGTIQDSLLNSYVFMLGGFDPSAFEGTPLNGFATALSCFYMLIVSILLLNLLIALMGDSYGSVKEKGLAQWKLEQAQIVTEMQGSMSAEDRECSDVVYFRSNRQEVVEPEQDRTAVLEATVQDLKYSQKRMMKLLLEQQERMQDQLQVNNLLKEFIASKMSL